MEVNEYVLSQKEDKEKNDRPPSAGNSGGDGAEGKDTNKGTLTPYVTCDPLSAGHFASE